MGTKKLTFSSLANASNFTWNQKKVALESFFYLFYARILLKTSPFKKIAAKLGEQMSETPIDCNNLKVKKAISFGKLIKKISQYTPFRSLCFEQAIALTILLKKRKIPSTTYLGVQKDKDGNELKAHAWTRVGNTIITGKKGMENFTVVSSFAQQKP